MKTPSKKKHIVEYWIVRPVVFEGKDNIYIFSYGDVFVRDV